VSAAVYAGQDTVVLSVGFIVGDLRFFVGDRVGDRVRDDLVEVKVGTTEGNFDDTVTVGRAVEAFTVNALVGDDEILASVILKTPLQELDEKHPSYRVYTWQIPVVM